MAVALPALGVLGLLDPARRAAEAVRGDGLAWLPVFVVVAVVACGTAVLPTHAVSLAAGFLFGTVLGTGTALTSVVGGAALGYALARLMAGGRLRSTIDSTKAGRALASAMVDARGGQAVLAVTLARLPPQVPFALGNVVAAASGVRLTALLAGTALGMLPRVAAVAWLGGTLAELEAGSDPVVVVVGIACATVGLLCLGAWSWRILRKTASSESTVDPDERGDTT